MADARPHRPGSPADSPYVEFQGETGEWRRHSLGGADTAGESVIGRSRACAICLHWDDSVSRRHARLTVTEGRWFIEDLGSNNGTRVDDRDASGRVRLRNGAIIRVGRVNLTLRLPGRLPPLPDETRDLSSLRPANDGWAPVDTIFLTNAQMRVFDTLMAPYRAGIHAAAPPTDAEIATALTITEETVRTHLQAIYRAYDLRVLDPGNPNAHKRRRLVERALRHPARPVPRRAGR